MRISSSTGLGPVSGVHRLICHCNDTSIFGDDFVCEDYEVFPPGNDTSTL